MSAFSVTLCALAGVYAYVALYHGASYLLRRRVEHASFAGSCTSLAAVALGGAGADGAQSVAAGVPTQQIQIAGLLFSLACFTDVALRIAGEPRPRLSAASFGWCLASLGLLAAGLFFDPGRADPSYDWATGGAGRSAMAALSAIGLSAISVAIVPAAYAASRLLARSRDRELRPASVLTAVALAAVTLDLLARAFDLTPYRLAIHAALLPVLGLNHVLVGRFTQVDVQLADRTEELARSHDDLRAAQAELVKTEQLAAVGELSAVIAHEVRNPLTIIKNAVGGLRREAIPPDDADTLLQILDEETDRLNRLVNDLLAYAKPISPDTGRVDLRTLVGHAVELAAGGNAAFAHVEIEVDLEREVDSVQGDEALLRHALINIVDNALQAMPQGGTLTITCRNTVVDGRPSVAVDFHDTGEGMDTLVRSRARDPFFTTRRGGAGLGLAIVDRVARVHGGRVEIESRHGRGTTVSFVVPRERTPA